MDIQNLSMTNLAIWENDEVTPLSFGAQRRVTWNRWDDNFDGYIDEVRIYNRALSTSEVQELYQGVGAKRNGVRYQWHCHA